MNIGICTFFFCLFLEFDRFLASRAAAVDQLPDIPAATGTQQPQRGGNRPTRQLQKEEEENTLFAL